MPRVTIKETDNTIYGLTQATNNNIVFIPGNAITGPTEATVVASKQDFIRLYGNHAPETDNTTVATSWDYATSLLQLGMPIMFKRVIPLDNEVEVAKKATTSITAPSYSFINSTGFNVSVEKEAEADNYYLTITFNVIDVPETVALSITKNIESASNIVQEVAGAPTATYSVGLNTIKIKIASAAPSASEGYSYWINTTEMTTETNYTVKITASKSSTSQDVNATFLYIISETVPSVSNVTFIEPQSKDVATVTAKYGGTYGNTLSYKIILGANVCYFRVYSGTEMIESKRMFSYTNDEFANKTQSYKTKIINAFDTVKFNSIVLSIASDGTDNIVNIEDMTNDSPIRLSGGTDATDAQILEVIPSIFRTTDASNNSYYEYGDKNLYDFKYITSGGYTDSSVGGTQIAQAMVDLAEYRGDCIAIPDIPLDLESDQVTTFFDTINSSYATAFAPWCYVRMMDKSTKWVAPSYIFLNALMKSINSGNEDYMPPVGVRRGSLANVINTEYPITTAILESWQNTNPQSINPIMKLQNYGYVIYGQRTLYPSVNADEVTSSQRSALQELFVRMVVNNIKKHIFTIATLLTFELNYLHTWNEFSARLGNILKEMKANSGINDYEIIIDETTQTDDMNTISGIVRVSILHMAENFYIDFTLEESNVTFNNEYTDEENF